MCNFHGHTIHQPHRNAYCESELNGVRDESELNVIHRLHFVRRESELNAVRRESELDIHSAVHFFSFCVNHHDVYSDRSVGDCTRVLLSLSNAQSTIH